MAGYAVADMVDYWGYTTGWCIYVLQALLRFTWASSPFYRPCQFEVPLSDSSVVVGLEGKGHFSVPDMDVGMVFFLLCHRGDHVDEGDSFEEGFEAVGLGDEFAVTLPTRELLQALFDFGVGQQTHHGIS